MNTKGTSKKKEKTNSADHGFGPVKEMFEMMSKCCGNTEGHPDCTAMMKGMMESMKRQCCMPDNDAESERKKK